MRAVQPAADDPRCQQGSAVPLAIPRATAGDSRHHRGTGTDRLRLALARARDPATEALVPTALPGRAADLLPRLTRRPVDPASTITRVHRILRRRLVPHEIPGPLDQEGTEGTAKKGAVGKDLIPRPEPTASRSTCRPAVVPAEVSTRSQDTRVEDPITQAILILRVVERPTHRFTVHLLPNPPSVGVVMATARVHSLLQGELLSFSSFS